MAGFTDTERIDFLVDSGATISHVEHLDSPNVLKRKYRVKTQYSVVVPPGLRAAIDMAMGIERCYEHWLEREARS